jgi:hypothetical protein
MIGKQNGKRFVILRPAYTASGDQLYIVTNWFEELRRMVPLKK